MTKRELTYREAGVDVDAGARLVDRVRPLAASTRIPEQLSSLGGFAGLCGLPKGMRDPVLVSGTDGVGTKLELAFALDEHKTVGIDLVAMCVNDIITCGARPLFFLDYFATAKLDVDRAESVIAGIAEGCRRAHCALLGGETAELPGFYAAGKYELAGFAVGVVERDAILDGRSVEVGDVVLGAAASGLHSNGFSLARHALRDALNAPDGRALAHELMTPTRIYVDLARAVVETQAVRALAHITGGGLEENLPRVLGGKGAELSLSGVNAPPIFDTLRAAGVNEDEMRKTFNMGVGFCIVVPPNRVDEVRAAAAEPLFELGLVTEREGIRFFS